MSETKHIEDLLLNAEAKISSDSKEAESLCMQALENCNKNNQSPEILYRIGFILSQCNNIDYAEKIWQEAIEDAVQKKDDYYKAFILHNVATIKADMGNVVEASHLWEESLNIKEKINDKKGIAATLNNLAWVAKLEFDYKEEKILLLKSINIFSELKMWSDITENLIKLSICDEENSLFYLSQAFYITTNYYSDSKDMLYIITEIIKNIGIDNKYSPVFASINLLLNNENEDKDIYKLNLELLVAVSEANNTNKKNMSDWVKENKLDNINYMFSVVAKSLEEMSNGKEWLFNPGDLQK